ncbi:hypothetical protein ARAM_002629 [Aspergillus rambellii]|uniref:ABC bile acid transporter n=1 Tax=Aspergillus rambellii TaxID=308745 RepID=A0A0F8XCN2_9EURO|nr:hypothetical protein ARAM_002629 [Aspergillus rambellii]
MPSAAEASTIITGVLGLVLILVCSVSALRRILHRFTKNTACICLEPSLLAEPDYVDEDGEATERSIDEFSDRWQKWAIAILSIAGFAVSLAQATVATCSAHDQRHFVVPSWLQMVGWMVLCVQPVSLFTEPSCVKKYYLGFNAFWASMVTILVLCVQVDIFWRYGYKIGISAGFTGLMAAQITTASLRAICSVLIPRRPNVYFEGQVVDQEFSVSIDNLPKLPFAARSETLHARLDEFQGPRKLWVALILRHTRALTVQALLSLVVCVLGFGPQVALYKILKVLEDRSILSADSTNAWLWVGGLGMFLALSSSIESWLWWLIYSDLWVPIYEGLSALVFAKSMRCKDVKHFKPSSTGDKSAHTADAEDEEAEAEDEEESKNRQSIINLAAVDSKRIADFVTFSYLIPSCVLRLAIAGGVLVGLIGWPSLLAGIAGAILLTPANSWLTKRYAAAQEELMKATDKRTGAVTEVLQGIRQVKFAALEKQWQSRISEKRRIELNLLWKTSIYTTGMVSVWIMGPLLLSAISLTVYALTRGELSPSVAFTTLSIFGSLESSLANLPDLISKGMEAKISADRIDKYLRSAEKISNAADVDQITFEDATVAWPSDEGSEDGEDKGWDIKDRFVLRHLTLQFPSKKLSVIAGKTGSGKSLLLASILGECDILLGSVSVPRVSSPSTRFDHLATRANWILDTAVAYVAQNPWMENATIKENILFGLPCDRRRYRDVLFASGLEKDMAMLPDGDLTDIGANGINLSGGQRWRISFARALYSRAGILIMDDIFSALDAETGRHVYEHALTGELGQGRTRILVTHHVGLCLPRTDYFVVLENGFATHSGTVGDLKATGQLADLLGQKDIPEREENPPATHDNKPPRRKRSSAGGRPSSVFSMHTIRKFIQEEKRETGSISMKVYSAYMNRGNRLRWWILAFLAYAAFMALLVGRSWWVSVWTGSSSAARHPAQSLTVWEQATTSQIKDGGQTHDLIYYLSIYVAISAVACVVGTLRCLALALAFIESSRQLFDDLLGAVLRAPLRWLDTVPLGRILNRFTSDIYLLDWRLGYDIGHLVYKALELAGILVAGATVSPMLLVLACVLLALCLQLSRNYLAGVREVKRLESTAKSPVIEKFGSSLAGLATIRAFGKAETYVRHMYSLIDRHAQASWYLWLFNRWLGFWLALVGAVFSTLTAALVVYMPGVSAALAGFAMSFALQYNYAVAMGLRFYANVEIDMNATERVLEYSNIETENLGGYDPPAAWPTRGKIEVEDLEVGYAPDLPPVLKGLTFTLENNQRVGVVGRTGAGKSSLTLALFRFLEARRGRIIVDGLDISHMKLSALRSRLAIIPQDPVLFSGTVRSNLDPFNEYSDLELYNALERVHLLSFEDTSTLASQSTQDPPSSSSTIGSSSSSSSTTGAPTKPVGFFSSLSSLISEGGMNLSQGQRQLLCLARAIVSRPKIMILDEATSAVDMETDALIQQSIRAEFGRDASSLLVIAHRLSTIADFDRILVMDAGKAVEFGSPKDLLQIDGGVFRSLVENSGERALVEEMILGKTAV